ncbi:dTMP kinase [Microvirga antarctica]|uniref:dTMP kinase n=1 Tax=Microvirga antarctica TaxID=2819233 RepID=UPI001B3146AA|nr:dTMP kinase [Microvirga antarctica]
MAGKFITFEGGEGAGKSTQIARLKSRLERMGKTILATREPGGSPYAEDIRAFILAGNAKPLGAFAEALLFTAARIDHIDHTIAPALRAETHVLCDRFADSTRAYQGASGEVEPALIRSLERAALNGLRPDLTLILDLPPETGLARAGARRETRSEEIDRFEAEDLTFHRKLRETFLAIARTEPDRCAVIDADRSADDVEGAIWEIVSSQLPRLAGQRERNADVA